MIPAGYMAKRIEQRPDAFKPADFEDIYSVSNCISSPFTEYIDFWKNNGYWFFDSIAIIAALASDQKIDLAASRFFFYEVYELEFDDETKIWQAFEPEDSLVTSVIAPESKRMEGYDVVAMNYPSQPGCSPLSCNMLALKHSVNRHCLLDSFNEAKFLIENGFFDNSEPGPLRIFGVYSVG